MGIIIIIIALIILAAIGKYYQRREGGKAYELYLDSLKQLNTICAKFGVPHQVADASFSRVYSAIKENHSKISAQIDAGELTDFRNKHELNEAYHDAMDLIEESEKLFVRWENIANPVG